MIPGVYRLIDGSLVQQLRFDTISNNLANSSTNAFKKDIISFDQILTMRNSSKIDFSLGPIRYTGNEFDIALDGPGLFKIQTDRGIRYTRDGSFALNKDQRLVTQSGTIVVGQNGSIAIDGRNVSFERDGTVVVDNERIDKIMVVDFKQPELLRKEGNSSYLYEGEEEDVLVADKVTVQSGYIEESNVNPTEEMIKMVEALRAFESAQKAIQCMDEITSKMVNDPGLLQ